jgi:hypothetical protein
MKQATLQSLNWDMAITNNPLFPSETLIQVKAGLDSECPGIMPVGEPFFATDTGSLYVGTGTGVAEFTPGAGGGGLPAIPATKMLYVDGHRTDSYTADGSIGKPFQTIMAAVDQIVANADNSTAIPYGIFVLTGVYSETIDLSNPALACLQFYGNGSTVGGLRAVNNDNLTDLGTFDFVFKNSSGHLVELSSTTNGTNFLNPQVWPTGWIAWRCNFVSSTGDFYVNNAGQFAMESCQMACNVNITNMFNGIFRGGAGFTQGPTFTANTVAGPQPAGFANTTVSLRFINCQAACVLNGAGTLMVLMVASRVRSPITINNGCMVQSNAGCLITSTITVNSGGEFDELGGTHSGTLTINSGGVYKPLGTIGAAALQLGTGATATPSVKISAGTGTPNASIVGNPGDLFLDSAGGAGNTLWVKESGTATNTGWVGK